MQFRQPAFKIGPAYSRLLGLLVVLLCLAGLPQTANSALTLHGHVMEDTVETPPPPPAPPAPGIIGVYISGIRGSLPGISEVYPGTPAQRAGIRTGDVLVAINHRSTLNLSAQQINEAISDIPGTQVTLLLHRDSRTFPVTLTVESLDDIRSKNLQQLYRQSLYR